MITGSLRIRLRAPWVRSLKEKRMIVRSLCARIRNRFNVSVAEVDEQDVHEFAVIGVACMAVTAAEAGILLDRVVRFVEGATDAEIIEETKDYYQ